MRKQIALLVCLALIASFTAGCSAARTEAPAVTGPSPAVTAPVSPLEDEAPAEPASTPEPEPVETAVPETREEEQGHYTFQPKVCSSCMTALFGEPMRDAWFSLVDAVMAGEDTFLCPDDETYWWVMGQFPDKCFPVLKDLIYYGEDVDHPVKDGTASFTYTVPKEEAARQIAEFAALVESILNETLRDDYSDLEKALALYIYFSHHYIYDYVAADPDTAPDYLSSYRVLTTGTGICQEFSVAYSYLLLQAGVDADTMSGHRSYDMAGHQWSFVRINGHDFHIDPTYVIGDTDALAYFMMTDAQREAEDSYLKRDFILCSNYAQDHPCPDYPAEDDSFRALWQGTFLRFDHETHTLYYEEYDDGRMVTRSFDYSGW